MRHPKSPGFTLIELSIVLVIIGLIVGSVLVGQDLIRAAAVRAQISQIERYQTAVNTFRGKYGALPGDLNQATATQFGFVARGAVPGEGDGNGLIQTNGYGYLQGYGETGLFWVDLSTAQIIEGSFTTASASSSPVVDVTGSSLASYMPPAKLGGSNYVYVWGGDSTDNAPAFNYFGLSTVSKIVAGNGWILSDPSSPGLTVQQAFGIDKKMDDGLPQSGAVLAIWDNANIGNAIAWAGSSGGSYVPPYSTAVPASPTTCFDNGGGSGPQQYSISQNNGANVNCALSFQFQ